MSNGFKEDAGAAWGGRGHIVMSVYATSLALVGVSKSPRVHVRLYNTQTHT